MMEPHCYYSVDFSETVECHPISNVLDKKGSKMRSFSCFNISTSTREWKLQFLSLCVFLLPSSTCVTHTSLLCSLYICFPPSLSLTLSLTNYLSSKLPPPPLSHSLIPTPFLIHRPSFYMSLYLFILLSLCLSLCLSRSV